MTLRLWASSEPLRNGQQIALGFNLVAWICPLALSQCGVLLMQVSDSTGSFRLYRKTLLSDVVKDVTSRAGMPSRWR